MTYKMKGSSLYGKSPFKQSNMDGALVETYGKAKQSEVDLMKAKNKNQGAAIDSIAGGVTDALKAGK